MIEFSGATRSGGKGPNDDAFVIGPSFAIVADGATAPSSRDSGCIHNVPWLVAQLCTHTASLLLTRPQMYLPDLLQAAIEATCEAHRETCDLDNPDSPSSTITIIRQQRSALDYVVLGDSPLILHSRDGQVTTIIDDRVDHLPDYQYDTVAKLRNHPDGFWVAAARPDAAHWALTGSVDASTLTSALLLTDGASRLVDRYGCDWNDVLSRFSADGPNAVLDQVHELDAGAVNVKGKRFDDATAVFCQIHDTFGN